jgi:very-short-patch-repair endonuclease
VECDGSQHADNFRDAIRDAWLIKEGFVVARFWNHEILQSPRMVEDTILARAGLPVRKVPLIRPSVTFSRKGRRG